MWESIWSYCADNKSSLRFICQYTFTYTHTALPLQMHAYHLEQLTSILMAVHRHYLPPYCYSSALFVQVGIAPTPPGESCLFISGSLIMFNHMHTFHINKCNFDSLYCLLIWNNRDQGIYLCKV